VRVPSSLFFSSTTPSRLSIEAAFDTAFKKNISSVDVVVNKASYALARCLEELSDEQMPAAEWGSTTSADRRDVQGNADNARADTERRLDLVGDEGWGPARRADVQYLLLIPSG
jgi:hypothetical protein